VVNARTLVVLHRQALIAEALASALGRYPWLAPIATGTRTNDLDDVKADAAVVDAALPGAESAAKRATRRGSRIVMLGGSANEWFPVVGGEASVGSLASALAPGVETRTGTHLSPREREVIALIAKGLAGKQVATALGISPKTVEQHKTRIFTKLGVANQAAAVAVAGRECEGASWTS
jgi:DNA-binding CsgD family transcriptional regulator